VIIRGNGSLNLQTCNYKSVVLLASPGCKEASWVLVRRSCSYLHDF